MPVNPYSRAYRRAHGLSLIPVGYELMPQERPIVVQERPIIEEPGSRRQKLGTIGYIEKILKGVLVFAATLPNPLLWGAYNSYDSVVGLKGHYEADARRNVRSCEGDNESYWCWGADLLGMETHYRSRHEYYSNWIVQKLNLSGRNNPYNLIDFGNAYSTRLFEGVPIVQWIAPTWERMIQLPTVFALQFQAHLLWVYYWSIFGPVIAARKVKRIVQQGR